MYEFKNIFWKNNPTFEFSNEEEKFFSIHVLLNNLRVFECHNIKELRTLYGYANFGIVLIDELREKFTIQPKERTELLKLKNALHKIIEQCEGHFFKIKEDLWTIANKLA